MRQSARNAIHTDGDDVTKTLWEVGVYVHQREETQRDMGETIGKTHRRET